MSFTRVLRRITAVVAASAIAVGGAILAPSAAFADDATAPLSEPVEVVEEELFEEEEELDGDETETTEDETTEEEATQDPADNILAPAVAAAPVAPAPVAPAAVEQVWEPMVSVSLADGTHLAEGDTVYRGDALVVRGSGFDPQKNISNRAPVTPGDASGNYVVFGNFAENWRPSAGVGTENRVVADQRWALVQSSVDNLDPRYASAVLRQHVLMTEDGTFEAHLEAQALGADKTAPGSYGVFTYVAGGGADDPAQEIEIRLNYVDAERPSAPQIQVFEADGVTLFDSNTPVTAGHEVVVRGTGFDPASNVGGRGMPIPADLPQGTYVVFGKFLNDWRPSEKAPSSARAVGSQGWVLAQSVLDQVPANYQGMIRAQWVPLSDEGAFEAKLTLADPSPDRNGDPVEWPEEGNFGVYTYGAGGVNNAAQELALAVNYSAEQTEPQPRIEVFEADGVTPLSSEKEMRDGDQVVVKGTHFDPAVNVGGVGVPIPADLPQGTFAVFGSFADEWQPSAGAPLSDRVMHKESRQWALTDASVAGVPADLRPEIDAQRVTHNDDGSFEATITLRTPDTPLEDGNWGIYTYPGGVNTPPNPAQERSFAINFVVEDEAGTEEPEEVATGGLLWSFKSSWNFYLINVAGGQRAASDGATLAGNTVGFVQVDGGDFDPETGLGTIRYQGTLRDTSEAHGYDIELSNPWVTFTADGATLSAEVSKIAATGENEVSRIDVAVLTPGEASVDEQGVLTWSGVPGIFAEGLQPDEWAEYANEAIDPVTFTFGTDAVDPTSPPAVTTSTPKAPQGGDIEFVGTGFEPGAQVTATVFSAPIVLGTKAANDNGEVRFAWTVPADFAVGEHRVELTSGDIVASAAFEVEAARAVVTPPAVTPEPQEQCVARQVTGGWLEWGFLAEFRNYVEGRIAQGTWSGGSFGAAGGALNPEQGGIGIVNFGGAIIATGHGGLMNYELSAPSIQITGPNSAVLYASTYTTDTSGNPAVSGRVALATLSFGSLNISGDTISVSGAAATLTPAGAGQFGDFEERYPAGTALDAVSFSVTLGGEVPCDSTTDPEVLAATGSAGSSAMTYAVLAMLIGAGLLAMRRREAV